MMKNIVLPQIKRVVPSTVVMTNVGVQPMSAPSGILPMLRYNFTPNVVTVDIARPTIMLITHDQYMELRCKNSVVDTCVARSWPVDAIMAWLQSNIDPEGSIIIHVNQLSLIVSSGIWSGILKGRAYLYSLGQDKGLSFHFNGMIALVGLDELTPVKQRAAFSRLRLIAPKTQIIPGKYKL